MRKSIKVICLLSVLLCFTMCTFSYAQEEGFIKRMWRRFISETHLEKKEKAATEEIVPEEAVAEQEAREIPPEEAPEEPELTRGEMIEIINENLDTFADELSSKVPNLVEKTDEEGKVTYLFKDALGKEVNFEDLDEESLLSLYNRVVNQAALLRRERTMSQMEQLRRIQEMQRQRQITQPPQVPGVPQVPRVPQPAIPPQPPKVYTPPRIPSSHPTPTPQPPQERR